MNAMVIGGSAEVDEESLVLGTWIDMFDESTQQWYAAKVVKVKEEENRVQVQFNGWGDRHNQWVEKVRCGAVGCGAVASVYTAAGRDVTVYCRLP